MDFTEKLIREYAKKIFGFACSKTDITQDAEDLSQQIILQLCDSRIPGQEIENMDAYIYRICFYTWSNYLRKNKRHWNAVNNSPLLELLKDEKNIEERCADKKLRERLRQEIMYLSKMRRDIIIGFYYENKSGGEIARQLGIPASTVRWHLRQTKIDLKERLEMPEQTGIYQPIKLNVGASGNVGKHEMNGLRTDILMQNICWICQDKALSVEEMARTLGVAAVYLEDKIQKLLYLDYLKTVGQGKYQANFFIFDDDFQLASNKYTYENTLPFAVAIFNLLKDHLENAKAMMDFSDKDNDNFLMWCLLPMVITWVIYGVSSKVNEKHKLYYTVPKRKDGTEHWVAASTQYWFNVKDSKEFDKYFKDFLLNGTGYGWKTLTDVSHHAALQFDLTMFGGWRDFSDVDLRQLMRVREIIVNHETPNEYDKDIISNQARKGYVRVVDGVPEIRVPYLHVTEPDTAYTFDMSWLQGAEQYLDEKALIEWFEGYIDIIKHHIPDFVDKNERNYFLSCYTPQYAIMYLLKKHGYLKEPAEDEKKIVCTVLFNTEKVEP